ncbi:MAG TPA: CaiB/BaiF CoA-transferase family protein [Acidimicrobiales bacterium]|jgi:crotonobetainyl-CoA:carnitine CoA-transferase CaiB-like acyl-CoA transferase|nr:CaiB/BaiF CoA-transferase family protein [Acidimicrobiales bacterium]
MDLGEISNEGAAKYGKPLEGVKILAAEQMQALPFATQLLARLGAEVVKIEHPINGESARGALPSMDDPSGRSVGATFLRNNLNKKSVGIDLSTSEGQDLFLRLVPNFDVVGDNFKPGTMEKFGLDYKSINSKYPNVIVISISGFGNSGNSPYQNWPAYNSVAEAMSGLYDFKRREGEPPAVNPMGAVGDIATSLFGVIGILAALRHRETTGEGQYIDLAMFDCMASLADVAINFHSMGISREPNPAPYVIAPFRCSDGYLVLQFVREHQFENLANLIGRPDWIGDSRFEERTGWGEHLHSEIIPALEKWAENQTRSETSSLLAEANVASGPVLTVPEVVKDPHLEERNMIVALPRTDGINEPILIPGNPIKMSKVSEGPEMRVPWVGEHTDEVLTEELGLSETELENLKKTGIISP